MLLVHETNGPGLPKESPRVLLVLGTTYPGVMDLLLVGVDVDVGLVRILLVAVHYSSYLVLGFDRTGS